MTKRIKFLISALLIFALFVSSFIVPVSSYETDVQTSTSDLLLVNLDTDTIVFSQKPDNIWYAGSLSESLGPVSSFPCYTQILTPHVASNYLLAETFERFVRISAENLKRYANGEPLENVVDRATGY